MNINIERSLKRFLKRKVKVTLGLVVAFMITGNIGYAEDYTVTENSGYIIKDSKNEEYENINLTVENAKSEAGIIKTAEKEVSLTTTEGNINFNVTTEGMGYGINSAGTSKNSVKLNSAGKIVINVSSSNAKTEGISGFNNSEIKLQAKKDIEIISKNNSENFGISMYETITYGVHYDTDTDYNNENIKINSDKNISIDASSNLGTTFGIYNKGGKIILESGENITIKSTVNNILDTFNLTNKSAGIYVADGVTTLNSAGDINIIAESKVTHTNGISLAETEKDTSLILSGNNVNIIARGTIERDEAAAYKQETHAVSVTKGNNTLNIDSEILNISSETNTGASTGVYSNGKIDLKGNSGINIISESKKGIATGLHIDDSKDNKLTSENGVISITANSDSEISYGMFVSKGEDINISGKSVNISSVSETKEGYGVYAINSTADFTGDTIIDVKGKHIDENTVINMDFAKETLEKGNNTISKIFATNKGVTGIVTQAIRANNSKLTYHDGLFASSSDIAMTAIGENAEINVNGDSHFRGNSYIIEEKGDGKHNLIARPVIQALDGGTINLNGGTYIESIESEDSTDDHITNVGIYSQGHTDLEEIDSTSTVNLNGDVTVKADTAIMATASGKVYINNNKNEKDTTVEIFGDIVAGKHESEISVSGTDMYVEGEVVAANGGTVTLDLTSEKSIFIGRADDYFDIEENLGGQFRNEKLSLDVEESGTVNINMDNGATWIVEGQSYITGLNFGENSGNVILGNPNTRAEDECTSLSIQKLKGQGTFEMTLDAEHKEHGDMLYIYDAESNGLQQTINLSGQSVLDLKVGEEIRFATLGNAAVEKGVTFKVNNLSEGGIKDVVFNVENEDYNINDEDNAIYNGEDTTVYKPGSDVIDDTYGGGENWFITRAEESDDVNDIGQTIVEMSKANYASAVYMDNLNKRLGDMRFADGKDGFWVRVRNDRVGEDSEYRLVNYMTQLGYDKVRSIENGTGHRGMAFEYTTGDMDYKNINGTADIDRKVFSFYSTRLYNNGFYSDYVLRAGRLDSEFDINGRQTGNKATGHYDNLFLGASAEYGYRMEVSENWYFEPQAQVQYTYVGSADYTTNQGTDVELSKIHSIIGRAGFRLGYDLYSNGEKTSTFYVKSDINHEFSGDQNVTASDKTGSISEKYENDGTWYDLGIGITKDLNEDINVYTDIEKQIGRTKDSNSWQFNLGFRYKF